MGKIGVGIITCDRVDYLKKCLSSLPKFDGPIVVVNDGKQDISKHLDKNIHLIQHKENKGVGISKNDALTWLLKQDIEHLFLLEDDIIILKPDTFERYIHTAEISGILHFNYGPGSPFNRKQDPNIIYDLHNRHLCDQHSEPNPKKIIEYPDGTKVSLFEHTVAMFSYFHRSVLEDVGLHDERFYNAWEHVDLTYRIIKAGYHPPFWWFADIHNSHEYLTEAPGAIDNSSIAGKKEQWEKNVMGGREVYREKHGHYPNMPPLATADEVMGIIKSRRRVQQLGELEKIGKVGDNLPDISQIKEEFDALLEFYRAIKPKNILEVGSLLGWSLKRFIENKQEGGVVVSVDLPVRDFCGRGDGRVDQQEFGHHILWKRWAKNKNTALTVIPASSFDPQTIKKVETICNHYDFIFIDGNHTYEGIMADYRNYFPFLRSGGIMAFHDIAQNEEGGGFRVWNEIKHQYKYKEILKSPSKEKGIGVILKP